MRIVCGLKNGAVLQRETNNLCRCFFEAEAEGKVSSSLGNVVPLGEDRYELCGIPVGGPYEIKLSDDKNEVCVKEIYVGDVWVLAGQSNMEGAGKMREKQLREEENPVPTVRAYYMNESWDTARPQLHQLWESADPWISEFSRKNYRESPWGMDHPEVQRNGVGPGLYFALEMQRRTGGVPQGLIPCGIGGSSLEQWKPDTPCNYYAAMKRRFRECGGNIQGVFCYQGESQTYKEGCESFVSDMQTLVGAMRRDFQNPELPFVQVQIHKYHGAPKEADLWWTRIRELQRTLDQQIERLATVYSADCGTDDLIHLSGESQEEVGKRAAEAMNFLITGTGAGSPQFAYFEIVQDEYEPFRVNIQITYRNIVNGLHSKGVASGFSLLEKPDGEPIREIARQHLGKNTVRLQVELDPEKIEEYYVCYGYGNTYYCNITDGAGRSIPAMGPLKIQDYLRTSHQVR